MVEEKLEQLVPKVIKELEYDDCFLVEVKINNTKVEIYIDSDESVTFEKCRKISRKVEAVLDEKKWLGEKYTLEVSSAGIGKPLKFSRQYTKNIGRLIEVKTKAGEKILGILASCTETEINVTYEEKVKEGKKNKIVEVVRQIQMEDIKESKIKVTL